MAEIKRRQSHVRRILALDTETTGLDPANDRVIEVACILWNVEWKSVEGHFSSLLPATENAAEHVNRIPAKLTYGAPASHEVWSRVVSAMHEADAVVAHNAPFDKSFVPKEVREFPVSWVCSKDDITWPVESKKRDLISIALAHGVPVYTAHRAMADADLIVRLLERCAELGHDVQAMLDEGLRRSRLPKFKYTSLEPYERKNAVKAAGFHWDGEARVWWREMNEEDAAKIKEQGIHMAKHVDKMGGA